MENQLLACLKENKCITKKFILAVSGGKDSMVLADLFFKLKLNFVVAHCNFQLRHEESNADENFVKQWCMDRKINFHSTTFDTKKIKQEEKKSTQELARELRYNYFEKLRQEINFDFICTAHHAGDQVETVFFNFLRGSGVKGLKGMMLKNKMLFRPLLNVSLKEIEHYIKENKIIFREDSSNSTIDYSRNKIRNEILPMIKSHFEHGEKGMLKSIKIHEEQNELMQEMIAIYRKKLMHVEGNEIHFHVRKIEKLNLKKIILYELLLPFGFWEGQMETVLRLLESENGKWVESPTHKLFRYQQKLILIPKNKEKISTFTIEEDEEKLETPTFILHIKKRLDKEKIKFDLQNYSVFIDEKMIHFPLVFRKWKMGDYIYPLGMKKKKKIARLLIDEKKSLAEKENQFVLESNQKILWATGLRSDERAKIKPSTSVFYEIKFEQK